MCSPCAPTPRGKTRPVHTAATASPGRPPRETDTRRLRRGMRRRTREAAWAAVSALARGEWAGPWNGWAALVDACATRSAHLLAAGAVGTDARLDPFPARGLPFPEIDDERPRSRHHDVQPPHSWRTKSVQTMCLDHEPARAWSRRYEAVHESYGSRVPLRARHACHSFS